LRVCQNGADGCGFPAQTGERQAVALRFMKRWLIPIMAVLMLLCFAIAFLPLTQREENSAKNDLSGLTNAAFERIAASQASAEPVTEAEEAALTQKARAVARFLAHDDALLAGDALRALCEQLVIDRIDVADDQGVIIASSDDARVGLALGETEGFAWTMDALNDSELSQADEADASVLYCSVPRTDIEGFVVLTRDDPFVEQAFSAETNESLIADMAYGGDLLFVAEPDGEDGFFYESGSLCLRSTVNGVTLIAARENSVIYETRNTALVALAAMLLCVMICVVAAYLMHLEFITPLLDERPEPEEETEEEAEEKPRRKRIAAPQEPEEKTEEGEERPRERVKRPKKQPEEPTAANETDADKKCVPEPEAKAARGEQAQRRKERDKAQGNAPRQLERQQRPRPKQKPPEPPQDVEEPFDKIVD